VMRYRLSVSAFLRKFAECEVGGHWKTSPADIKFGALAATPPQFIPPDADQPTPWNGVLKNNFFEGSHTLELFDTTKEHLRFLLEDTRRLTQLANVVGQIVPIKLDGMSDRLGNIIIQLPVTVFSTVVRNSPGGEHRLGIAWHPDVTPRQVQITAEILDNAALSSFDSAVITTGEATLELNARGGGGRIRIWDLEKRVLLCATPAMRFFTSLRMSTRAVGEGASAKSRKFRFTDFDGNECQKTICLKEPSELGRLIGSPPERPREPWVAQRVFRDSISSLRARKEFVQYGLDADPNPPHASETSSDVQAAGIGQEGPLVYAPPKHKRKTAALEDLHELICEHGDEGVWLWDPYLNADDVLRTRAGYYTH
ncbi:VPA1262 family N-terminal domain-containing protein, partial [Pseudomonas sp. PA-3-11C]|uniref:VPA1262 family N-terminal domain-containing protein n=1 Tax=Pseudomonas sp. PA-3-11C TaxID=2665472 RepID=UPI001EEED6FF